MDTDLPRASHRRRRAKKQHSGHEEHDAGCEPQKNEHFRHFQSRVEHRLLQRDDSGLGIPTPAPLYPLPIRIGVDKLERSVVPAGAENLAENE
jgi:hypothetical protein